MPGVVVDNEIRLWISSTDSVKVKERVSSPLLTEMDTVPLFATRTVPTSASAAVRSAAKVSRLGETTPPPICCSLGTR